MTFSLTTAFTLGLDGFIVCVALGPLRFGPAGTRLLAMAFGACDALAMLAGAAWGMRMPWEGLVPSVLAASVLLVLLFPARARTLAFCLPVPLALDNFLASARHGTTLSLTDAALTAAVSASVAFAGLYLGASLARGALSRRTSRASRRFARLASLRAAALSRPSLRYDERHTLAPARLPLQCRWTWKTRPLVLLRSAIRQV